MVKKFAIIAFVLLGIQYVVNAQDNKEIFTIYLVRHAEKELSADSPKDPPLTQCGQLRAESLAVFFGRVDLDAVYSTDYTRTKSTAEPTASTNGMEIKMYNPGNLNHFAKLLIDRKEDALVVGHSNTTGALAGLLIGEEIGSMHENVYNRIYQVVIYKDTGRIHIFQSSFICSN